MWMGKRGRRILFFTEMSVKLSRVLHNPVFANEVKQSRKPLDRHAASRLAKTLWQGLSIVLRDNCDEESRVYAKVPLIGKKHY